MNDKKWFWIAINGSSCAACNFPTARVYVTPTPEMIFGFTTQEEQLRAQDTLLNAPIDEVKKFAAGLMGMAAAGVVKFQRFPNPEPQTDGPTIWSNQP